MRFAVWCVPFDCWLLDAARCLLIAALWSLAADWRSRDSSWGSGPVAVADARNLAGASGGVNAMLSALAAVVLVSLT